MSFWTPSTATVWRCTSPRAGAVDYGVANEVAVIVSMVREALHAIDTDVEIGYMRTSLQDMFGVRVWTWEKAPPEPAPAPSAPLGVLRGNNWRRRL